MTLYPVPGSLYVVAPAAQAAAWSEAIPSSMSCILLSELAVAKDAARAEADAATAREAEAKRAMTNVEEHAAARNEAVKLTTPGRL